MAGETADRPAGTLRAALRREAPAALGLLGVAAVAWAWLWGEAARMEAMPAGMAMAPAWSPGALVLVFLMWAIMMAAMMLPSALPAILLYAGMTRGRRGAALPAAWTFAAGYVAVWTGFSLLAAVMQTGLAEARLLSPMMESASLAMSGALLVVAGLWQWLPFKDACLARCRNPLSMFLFGWRAGPTGAFRMGARHGLYCLGCCWALMLLLFAVGVMNLLWVAALAAFVLAEKLLPQGRAVGRVAGVAMIAAGAGLLAASAG